MKINGILTLAATLLLTSVALHASDVCGLRCECRENPLGVDAARLRLSWIMEDRGGTAAVRGQKQTAYQVLAASTPEALAKDKGDLWDSGKVASDQSTQVEYSGKPLESRRQCYWKVRVWDKNGAASAWSDVATWTMGLLTPDFWNAKWIGAVTNYEQPISSGGGNGYHAAEAAREDELKWVQVDLGKSIPIERVVLHSNLHGSPEKRASGFGFPIRFRIEVTEDADFKTSKVITDQTAADYPNPGHAAVGFDVGGVTARYVRVTATKLWKRGNGLPYCFSLAQLEVVSAGKNVALHAPVTGKDSVEGYGWSKAGLTDGKRFSPPPSTQPKAAGTGLKPSATIQLRKEFALEKEIKRAVVYVCGLGQFELRLNGRKVGENVLEPGWTDYRKTCLYSAYDVTGQLARGRNAIGLMLGNGMYNVPGGRYTKFTGSFGPPKVILQLHVEHADGTSTVVTSDDSWAWALSPVVFSCVYGGEDYDARKEMPGWDTPGFSQSAAWKKAVEMPGPGGKLVGTSLSAPPIKVHQTFDAASPESLGAGVWLYDLGQNCSVLPCITVEGLAGAEVGIETGERWANGKFAGACDRLASFHYTLRGGGKPETWASRFTYAGARYLKVTCSGTGEAQARVLKVQGHFVASSSTEAGSFECSSDLFNRTARIIRWAMRSNMMSILTDCPHREKLGWLEQIHLVGPSLIYSYDLQCLLGKMTGDMADAQLPNGMVPDIAPEYTVFNGGFRDSPEWGSACVLTPWNLYQWYGDSEILARRYETMARYVAYLESKAKENVLTHGLGDWYALAGSKRGATATAFYFLDLKIMENAAKVLGKDADARSYAAKAEAVRQAYNKLFFSGGGYGGQTDNALPLAMEIAETKDRAAALASLVEDIRKRGNALTAGDVGYRYVLRALAQSGRSDVIYDMSTRADKPGYAMILAKGNTSLTEPWDGSGRSSSNHFMLGHIMEWFYADLAGIQAGAPGFKSIVIKPQPVGNLSWVAAHYDCPYGRIVSNWKREGGRLTMDVTIPANTAAEVHVPANDLNAVTESGKPITQVEGVKFLRIEDAAAVYAVVSGVYRFQSGFPETGTPAN